MRQRVRSFMFWMHLIRSYGGPFRVVQHLKRERDEFLWELWELREHERGAR